MALLKDILKENGFEGAPGGGGAMNYGNSYGTPNSSTQDPSKFSSSDKTTNHMSSNTESTSSAMMTAVDRPGIGRNAGGKNEYTPVKVVKPNTVSSQQTLSPETQGDVAKSEKPLDQEKDLDPKVDQLFQKKDTPSPDEIMSAIQYELGNMVKKDKFIAKQNVLKNMKGDPHYYSRLDMLNIDDKKMKVTEKVEETTFSKTKAVLDEMIAAKQKRVAIANTPEISKIFKDLLNKRNGVSS